MPHVDGAERVLTTGAVAFVNDLARRFGGRIDELLERRHAVQRRFNEGARPNFLSETASVRAGDWQVAPAPADLAGPARRDHRPGRPQDDHQRAQLGRAGVHGRLRGRHVADLGQRRRRPGEPDGRRPAHDLVRGARDRQALRAERAAGHADGASARLPSRRAPLSRSTAARFPACSSTSACIFFHNAAGAEDAGTGPYFYLPKLREPPRGASVERRVHPRAAGAGHSARHDQGDGAHRDAAGRLRDGRDPVRAARITAPA